MLPYQKSYLIIKVFLRQSGIKLIQKNTERDQDEDQGSEKEEYDQAKKKLSKAKVKMYINAGFAFIIYAIALVNLFGAI